MKKIVHPRAAKTSDVYRDNSCQRKNGKYLREQSRLLIKIILMKIQRFFFKLSLICLRIEDIRRKNYTIQTRQSSM